MSVAQRRLEVFDHVLGLFAPGRLVDLGAGHGRFALRAARAGWSVTAVDARADRWPADRGTVRWLQEDVRQVDLRPYDVVACLGLFYHLTPRDQVHLLRRVSVPLVLDTHVATGEHAHALGSPTEVRVGGRTYDGAWYREPGRTTSSHGNSRSFWPTAPSLHRMLRDGGFPVVLEVRPWITDDRTFFLALPEGHVTRAVPATLSPGGELVHAARRIAWHARRRIGAAGSRARARVP